LWPTAEKNCSYCGASEKNKLMQREKVNSNTTLSLRWCYDCQVCRHQKRSIIYSPLRTLIYFTALTLLVGRQEGHPACKKTEWWDVGVVVWDEVQMG